VGVAQDRAVRCLLRHPHPCPLPTRARGKALHFQSVQPRTEKRGSAGPHGRWDPRTILKSQGRSRSNLRARTPRPRIPNRNAVAERDVRIRQPWRAGCVIQGRASLTDGARPIPEASAAPSPHKRRSVRDELRARHHQRRAPGRRRYSAARISVRTRSRLTSSSASSRRASAAVFGSVLNFWCACARVRARSRDSRSACSASHAGSASNAGSTASPPTPSSPVDAVTRKKRTRPANRAPVIPA
jgi:hypothetical protein